MGDYTVVVERKGEGQTWFRVFLVSGASGAANAEDVACDAYSATDEDLQYPHRAVATFSGLHLSRSTRNITIAIEQLG